ncbi:EpsG family protein [Photobacterium phosphoreum]|uniref:EpsG family protein n=1 Tax=Photobacterium phosphoreum TaxID=659 RepID=UPI001E5B0D57|nr:EpsG family protein [Photobacterium phosphoreum]MCD9521179.1 hypothetical protein [Photobacterium phosphoreum]
MFLTKKSKCFIMLFLSVLLIINPFFSVIFIGVFSPFLTFLERKLASFICVSFAIVFYCTLQPFGDLAEYLDVYNNINNIDIFDYKRFGMGIEVLILFVMKIVSFLSDGNKFAFLFSIYSIIFLLLVSVCKKIDNRYYVLIFLTIFLNYGFLQSNSYFLRQIISVLFIFLMFFSIRNEGKIIYSFLAIISHVSGMLALVSYVILQIKSNKKILGVMFFLGIVIVFISYYLGIFSYILDRLDSSSGKFSVLNPLQILEYNISFLLIFYFLWRYKAYICKDTTSLLIIIFAIINFVFFWGLIKIPAMSNRLALFMCAFPTILLTPIIKGNVTFWFKYQIILMLLIINIVPIFYTLYCVELKGSELNFLNYQPISSNLMNIIKIILDRISGCLPYISQGN